MTLVVSKVAAWFVQLPAPAGERSNCTVATPEPPSAELLISVTEVPRRFAPGAGAVTPPVGDVLSIRTVTLLDAVELPETSLVNVRRS